MEPIIPTPDFADRLETAEEALIRCERLATANRFAGAIMHEVNNPLEALINLVFLTKMTSQDENVIQNMEIAETQLTRLGEITQKSLNFYRDQEQAREDDVIGIAEAALTIHAHRLREQKVELRKRIHAPARARVFAGEILQVISNLILNALDAMPDEKAALCVRVRMCPERVHITVADNGSGIEPDVFKNLFTANRTTKEHGTGFGLWLVKSIVEKHQGNILCRTSQQPGRSGTTFRVCLPAA